ncbi:MAG TPA: mannose-1-phosphate guanylyltransferase/mannose-6-phosphate isomerase [Dissulfurispiraceae bacterium]|nr:mannose-1-phosphate guanylyltransferase/mannose-6-phosphate isomerase [Dissulfurispiraceae bacterium]
MNEQITVIPTILCGGAGTRLWPLSREQHPKQLLPLSGSNSLLQQTAVRLAGIKGHVNISPRTLVVCNEQYRFLIAEQLREIGLPGTDILLEPAGRNTAPALALAALHAEKERPGQLLLVMPSDHVISNRFAFHDAVIRGLPVAAQGCIVAFGVMPVRPETGYGYINAGAVDERGALPIIRFVEKPDRNTAQQYIACGGYFWNSGIFLVRADIWLKALTAFAPAMVEACERAHHNGVRDMDFFRIHRDAFISCPADSIDYAVMEKLPSHPELGIGGFVIPLDAGWSDLGSWDAVWTAAEKDASGNSVSGDALLEDTRNSLVHADGRLVACVGLDDIVVVETADAVLVARKDRVQNVKHIVAKLKRIGRVEASLHRKVARPWGTYDCVDIGERFQVKRIIVKPGAVLSLQMHHHRAEHWIVVRGTARITRGDESLLLSENQSTYIPLGVRHRLENPGKVPLELIEVQSGSYLGEDDIVRFEDLYGRRKDPSA